MTATATSSAPVPIARKTQILDPVSRTTEVLFGLIMVLTFTASLNVSEAGRDDVRLMLAGAIGCCLAWGIIDAAMFLLSVRAEKALSWQALSAARSASPEAGRQAIAEAMPPIISSVLQRDELESLRQRLTSVDPGLKAVNLTRQDWIAAFAVFLLVFLSTVPVALPFLFFGDIATARWASHAVALMLLFAVGYSLGRHWNRALHVGLAMVALGVTLVGIALVLGG